MTALIPTIPENAGRQGLQSLTSGYEIMLLRVLKAILDRFERDDDYHFIDTKLDLNTGRDFYPVGDKSEACRSREVIYTWIQGRGLEAMAGHLRWLSVAGVIDAADRGIFSGRIRTLLTKVVTAMEELRSYNQGRVYFCMTAGGLPLEIVDYRFLRPAEFLMPESNFSDLYYARGLFAAAWELGWGNKADEAATMFRKVLDDILHQRFRTDQQQFDPANPIAYHPGRCESGPFRAALGGIALIGGCNEKVDWFGYAARMITQVLDHHANLDGRLPELQPFDFYEAADKNGHPWPDDGTIVCDPGHMLEFIGQAARCLLHMTGKNEYRDLVARCREVLPSLLLHGFELGFNPAAGGITKRYDLMSRRPLNSDLPWWSLPETMRAAALLLVLDPESPRRDELERVIIRCSNAFVANYINDRVDMMAIQNRNAAGEVTPTIPATPDADPGYHTGLSVIDLLRVIEGHRML